MNWTLAELGNYSLAFAAIAACTAIFSAILAWRYGSANTLRVARAAIYWMTGVLTFSCVVLMVAIFRDDFSLKYIANYSRISQSWGYKIAAFWAGRQGSLLLWVWMLAVMTSIAVFLGRKAPRNSQAATLIILALVCALFPVLLMFVTDTYPIERTDPVVYRHVASNPFFVTDVAPPDGQGMKPLLQNPAMIAHPPLLFLGYAGLTIPFAMGFGSFIARRKDSGWIGPARRWTVVSWLFLTAGIVLGCEWAYVELNWGGYWAWDPVENASLLPWFTATALIHSLFLQQRRGIGKCWNAWLLALSFILCIVATFLTRAGLELVSVHTFGSSGLVDTGRFFLGVIIATTIGSAIVMIWRHDLLGRRYRLGREESAQRSVHLANVILTCAMLLGLILMVYPLVRGEFLLGGQFFLSAIGVIGLGSVGVMIWRSVMLQSERQLERVVSHETSILVANGLLTVMMFATLFGTIFPLIMQFVEARIRPHVEHIAWLADRLPDPSEILKEEYYNKIILPMFLVLIFLMGLCLALQFSKNRREMKRRLFIPLITMHAALLIMVIYRIRLWGVSFFSLQIEGLHEATDGQRAAYRWLTVAVMATVLVVAAILDDVIRAIALRLRSRQQGVLTSIGQTMHANLRRYGGLITHLGVVMFVIGVAASSLFSSEEVTLERNKPVKVRGKVFLYDSQTIVEGPNYTARELGVTVLERDGTKYVIRPQLRYYDGHRDHASPQVAIRTGLREDLYIKPGLGTTRQGVEVAFATVRVKPMVLWLWIGSITMLVGSLLALISGRRKTAGAAPSPGDAGEEQ